jgi:predicted outer membrane repeat protein
LNGNGGAAALHCSIENLQKCLFFIKGNQFSYNEAGKNGGAISYDLFSPIGLLEN